VINWHKDHVLEEVKLRLETPADEVVDAIVREIQGDAFT